MRCEWGGGCGMRDAGAEGGIGGIGGIGYLP